MPGSAISWSCEMLQFSVPLKSSVVLIYKMGIITYAFTSKYWFFFLYKFIYFIYLFFGCTGSSLLHMGFLQLRRTGATLAVCVLLIAVASLVAEHGFQAHGLSRCGARAQLLRDMWDLPGPGIEPMSPALAGGFFTTAPPGKSLKYC